MEWQERAACAQAVNRRYVETFFGDQAHDIYRAKRICSGCPVREPCFDLGMESVRLQAREPELSAEDAGIWGGYTGRELADLDGLPSGSPVKLRRDRGIGLLVQNYNVAQVAKLVGVTQDTVREWQRAMLRPELPDQVTA